MKHKAIVTMTKILIQAISLFSILFFMNCATLISDNKYVYSVSSTPSDVEVTVQDFNATIGKFKTPSKIDVHMKRETVLKFEAKGYSEKYFVVERGINKWTWANLAFGCSICIAIDYFSGSIYKPLDNKTDINIILEPSTVVDDKKGKKVSILYSN